MNPQATLATRARDGAPPSPRSYARHVAMLTQHDKELLIAPVLQQHLLCRVERAHGYDTDRLGTFTGETPRAGSQLDEAEGAIRNAHAAARHRSRHTQ